MTIIITIIAFVLGIFSYSQVDLNLTLSGNHLYQLFQHQLTLLGYYQRPLSTLIYIVILFLMTCVYFYAIFQSKNQKFKFGKHLKVLLTVSILLTLAYPAFSADIFNYIFDARILLEHQANPYTHTALDFPTDDWTRFMRWTHRTYPYGPTWLPLTLVVYALGLGKFVTTLVSFKLLGLLGYWVSLWSIREIVKKTKPKSVDLSLTLFAFNPLILIEGLVSMHLDLVMMALMLLSLALLVRGQRIGGWITLLISSGIKYVSGAVLLPLLLWQIKKLTWPQMLNWSLVLSYLLVVAMIWQREVLPWYVLVPFGLTALVPHHKFWVPVMLVLTPALLVRYAPFLYYGEYTASVNWWRDWLTISVIGMGILGSLVCHQWRQLTHRRQEKVRL